MGYLIIHVEDDPNVSESVKLVCEVMGGHRVISYEDGYKLVEFIKKTDESPIEERIIPDVFILDVMLTSCNGFDLIPILRQSMSLKNIPILMLSARAPALDIILEPNRSADNYLTKPFDILELLQMITEIVAEYQWRNTAD